MTAIELSPEEMNKLAAKKEKKEKKRKKKRSHEEVDDEEEEEIDTKAATTTNDTSDDDDDETTTTTRTTKKREEKKKLMAHVPERDADGIAYTKIQRRRMMKRVKRGLDPVPTPREESERLQNEAQLKRDEEAELDGTLFAKEEEKDDDSNDDEQQDTAMDEDDNKEETTTAMPPVVVSDGPKKDVKKQKRAKVVPVDYVCSACKNKHTPIHWIYDCPDKVTMRGTNQISKKQKGVHDPDGKKVFVSGLSFEAKRKDVEGLFASCGKLTQCKLLTFEDTGRCKGQAYLTFETEASAKQALAMSGTTVENTSGDATGKDGKPKEIKRKELKLKVTKMLNRFATKKGSR